MWGDRSDALNKSFVSDIFEQFCLFNAENEPINHSLQKIKEIGFDSIDEICNIKQETKKEQIYDIISLMNDDLSDRKTPFIYRKLNEFNKDFISCKSTSKNFVKIYTPNNELIYWGQINKEKNIFEG